MCYEMTFFWRRARSIAQDHEEMKAQDTERSSAGVLPIPPRPDHEKVRRKEIERELEETV